MSNLPTPSSDFVLIDPISDTSTKSGILLRDKIDKIKGVIVAIGPGRLFENGTRNKIDLEIGDVVWFKDYMAERLSFRDDQDKKDKSYILVDYQHVMCKLYNEKKDEK